MNQLDPVVRRLREQLPALTILENEPMRAHCSFRIGGPVRALAQPSSAEETAALCRILRSADVTPLIIGNGTNLLVTDAELNRIVIQMGDNMAEAGQTGPDTLQAGCGIPLARLAQTALACGLGGMEFAHGIPGSLGGAVSMNAGAYGGEMKDIVVTTQYLDESLEVREVHGAAHDFGYRHSRFSDTGAVILASTLRLTPGDPAAIRARMAELSEKRRASQPLELPSAGSTFKRPVGGYAAALIEQAGLKGYTVGGAQVSEKHAGFVVNRGGATFDDVLSLIDHIRAEVLRTSGIELETEVKIIRG
ncbi:MAG: UDP-N-acetylmuramate dehydrogenase [Clostridiales bacterium]|nr:UDP-N-acetylmuramate dehydrogenase [Clostridiales bacterium]MDD6937381.1 UDP-N-acetylmuramate dehydrogenase [Clostridiales bacterium]MDY2960914.1 UDP-N-acetylmuramate dehydrogenase [Oscillospiraceae bacterium]